MIISLSDNAYEFSNSRICFNLIGKEAGRYHIKVSFEFGKAYASTIQNVTFMKSDIEMLTEQIEEMRASKKSIDYLSFTEPNLQATLLIDEDNVTVIFNFDAGQENEQMGTDSGPAILVNQNWDGLLGWAKEMNSLIV